jgi:hypothetical protein
MAVDATPTHLCDGTLKVVPLVPPAEMMSVAVKAQGPKAQVGPTHLGRCDRRTLERDRRLVDLSLTGERTQTAGATAWVDRQALKSNYHYASHSPGRRPFSLALSPCIGTAAKVEVPEGRP